MKKTAYITMKDEGLLNVLKQVDGDVSTIELIDEQNDLDVMVLSRSDWAYLVGLLDSEERERFSLEDTTDDWSKE
ncbi:hypothetical protein RV11_GL002540 [Enterococcus phoeniculicola]|jgi:hypothetical protein|uniref:Uncharacterized protein n=1 Tax=Enterococcus phoeniculicola ATCC BAA-412 TaxID=1158610 RepID=R3TYD9_9ENTE|nr:hypothetical protein [Enterococcus phoeniculicola]EOL46173.1 hypothetical protein UC3_00979 [Enterococcus phoeniculicola ATCC BAA-412]EOT76982.1 hypothetical protein I589_01943 [Enterococcus phoeniculicola ATCC BAA-412]OJG69549.1 hypothetical protein RV11_GL002540 [Enterococcus phoeniculicola]